VAGFAPPLVLGDLREVGRSSETPHGDAIAAMDDARSELLLSVVYVASSRPLI
jgi:hypothetical protein